METYGEANLCSQFSRWCSGLSSSRPAYTFTVTCRTTLFLQNTFINIFYRITDFFVLRFMKTQLRGCAALHGCSLMHNRCKERGRRTKEDVQIILLHWIRSVTDVTQKSSSSLSAHFQLTECVWFGSVGHVRRILQKNKGEVVKLHPKLSLQTDFLFKLSQVLTDI